MAARPSHNTHLIRTYCLDLDRSSPQTTTGRQECGSAERQLPRTHSISLERPGYSPERCGFSSWKKLLSLPSRRCS